MGRLDRGEGVCGGNVVAAALVLCAIVGAAFVWAREAESADKPCLNGTTRQTLETGIVMINGCWTKSGDLYTAKFADQPDSWVDMNGFLLTKGNKKADNAITVDTKLREVVGVGDIQLNSASWPAPTPSPLGDPTRIAFVAPERGELHLQDLRFGSSSIFAKSLAGFSPVGSIEIPIEIGEKGTGSMNLVISLAGIFTLKGKAQSATIDLPTEIGKGTKLNGFELELNEIDSFKVVVLENFSAYYKAAEKKFGGEAAIRFPFMSKSKDASGKGIILGFGVENGELTNMKVGATGLKLPLGTPPAGYVTGISGGFTQKPGQFTAEAKLALAMGEEVPLPIGKVYPVQLDNELKIGSKDNQFYFGLNGAVKIFNMEVGQANFAIYGKTGVEFGVGVGIGLPSFKNSPNDPFYIGARVDGWFGASRFQFEGRGRFSLFGVRLLEGRAMINQTAIGACWKVFWFDGGAVYEYGKSVRTFGTTCGLDRYRQQFRAIASASASAVRSIDLGPRDVILNVKGDGEAPRFSLESRDGRRFVTPTEKRGVMKDDYGVFVNENTDVTHVLLRRPEGSWTIRALEGSSRIISIRSGQAMRPEEVEAKVLGRGINRTLVWDSIGQPNTQLVFTEVLKGGIEKPVLVTGAASGKRSFKVSTGGHYGQRKIRVSVIHGHTMRDQETVAKYRVNRPPRLSAPRRVIAHRDVRSVRVNWSKVKGSRGYLVRVSSLHKGKPVTSYMNIVGPKKTRLAFHDQPGSVVSLVRVYALNVDGRLGRPGRYRFQSGPRRLTLRAAARRSAHSAKRNRSRVTLVTVCPPQGAHCLVNAQLSKSGRNLAFRNFQQPPGTYNRITFTGKKLSAGRLSAKVRLRLVGTNRRSASRSPVRGR